MERFLERIWGDLERNLVEGNKANFELYLEECVSRVFEPVSPQLKFWFGEIKLGSESLDLVELEIQTSLEGVSGRVLLKCRLRFLSGNVKELLSAR